MANKGKQIHRPPSLRLKKVFKLMSGGVRTVTEAQRLAGYSDSYIDTGKIMKTKTYIETLNSIGMTDDVISKEVMKLATARRHEQKEFPHKITRSGKGKRARVHYAPPPREEIEKYIQALPDAVLSHTVVTADRKTIAYFTVPDQNARKSGLEMLHKAKSLFAPLKIEGDMSISTTDEEKAAVDAVLGKNKK